MTTASFEIQHPQGPRIAPGLTEPLLLQTIPSVIKSKRDMGTGWVWYSLPPFEDGEIIVAISLGFNLGTLGMIGLADAHDKFGTSWSEWSEDKERARASSIGSWLTKRGIGAGNYSWGSVWVGYDPKGGGGSATVRLSA